MTWYVPGLSTPFTPMSHKIPPTHIKSSEWGRIAELGGQWTKFTMTSLLPRQPTQHNGAINETHKVWECRIWLVMDALAKKTLGKMSEKKNVLSSVRYKMAHLIGQTAQYISCLHLSCLPPTFWLYCPQNSLFSPFSLLSPMHPSPFPNTLPASAYTINIITIKIINSQMPKLQSGWPDAKWCPQAWIFVPNNQYLDGWTRFTEMTIRIVIASSPQKMFSLLVPTNSWLQVRTYCLPNLCPFLI